MPKISTASTIATPDLSTPVSNAVNTPTVGKALLQFADTLTKNKMQEAASVRYLEGQQAIAQGSSLQDVKDNQASYTKWFGESASVQGARKLSTEVALDDMKRNSLNSVSQNAGMSPKEYAQFQQKELATIVSGMDDTEQRQAITIAYAKNAGQLADMHLKAHANKIDSDMRTAYTRGIYSKAQAAQESVGTPLEVNANQELLSILKRPEGMGEAAYHDSVVETMKASMEGGNGALYNAFVQSDILPNLTPEQQSDIYRAHDKYEKGQLKEVSIQNAQSASAMKTYAMSADADVNTLLDQLREHKTSYGLTAEKAESLLNTFRSSRKDAERSQDLSTLGHTRQFSNMSAKDKSKTLDLMRTEMGEKYPEYWASIGVRDTVMSKDWTASFSSMVLADGSVDPRFVEKFEEFQEYNSLDTGRAFDHITDDDTKLRLQAVLARVAVDGDINAAVRGRQLIEQNNKGGGFTKDQTADIRDAVLDVSDGVWYKLGDDMTTAFNSSYATATMERTTKDYMLNGRANAKDAAELARRDFEQKHDLVKGDYIPNGGIAFKERLGLQGDDTVDESLDMLINDNRTEMFGSHEGGYSSTFNISNNSMTFIPIDDNGLPVAGGITLNVDGIRAMNTLSSAKAEELSQQAAADAQEDSLQDQIFQRKLMAARNGNEITDKQALANINKSNEVLNGLAKSAVKTSVEILAKTTVLGLATSNVLDLFVPKASAAEKETGKANIEAHRQGLAPLSKTGLGWGLSSTKATGPSEEIGQLLDVFAMTESSSGKYRANPTSSARGLFQYLTKEQSGGNNAMQTAVNRAKRQMKEEGFPEPEWMTKLSNTAFNGSDKERSGAMIQLDDDKSAALLLWEMKSRPQTRELLEQAQAGDTEAVRTLYYKYHHTNPDKGTVKLFEKNFKIIYGE